MKKRLLCLLLSSIMLLSVGLIGCSKKTDEEEMSDITETASESAITLSMYLMSEKEISDEQVSKIEDAVNKITKSKFKTKLVLHYFTEEQYYTALEEAFAKTDDELESKAKAEAALKEAINKGEATELTTKEGEVTEEATEVNEYGVTTLKYPGISENQVDIFYLGGYDKFDEYTQKGLLSALDEELGASAKTLSRYVAPEYLSHMKTTVGDTFAIPNNRAVGEYTYMLLNKDVLKKYHFSSTKSFTSLACADAQELLGLVSKYDSDRYAPLYSDTGEIDIPNVGYLGVDENGKLSREFSVIGTMYDPSYVYRAENNFYSYNLNFFQNADVRTQLQVLAGYKENGYYNNPNSLPYAVRYTKGCPQDVYETYAEDYEIVVVERPKIDTMDLFEHTFAVSKYTPSVTRSMKIINYLNTNADFRNLMLYGIEGENYEVVERVVDGVTYKSVTRLNEDYMMDENKTGNVLLSYPLSSEPYNIREYQKAHNRDLETVLDMGYIVSDVINATAMAEVRKLSAEVFEALMACDTVDKMLELIGDSGENSLRAKIQANQYVPIMMRPTYNIDSPEYNEEKYGEGDSFAYLYEAWLLKEEILVIEEE